MVVLYVFLSHITLSCLFYMEKLLAFFEEHRRWSLRTFGKRKPEPPLYHLQEEVEEMLDNPKDIKEYADGILLIMDAAQNAGFTPEEVIAAMMQKFHTDLVHRKWNKPNKKGYSTHRKEKFEPFFFVENIQVSKTMEKATAINNLTKEDCCLTYEQATVCMVLRSSGNTSAISSARLIEVITKRLSRIK